MAIGDSAICAREGCAAPFIKKTANQIYHNDACTKIATNAKIIARYHANKQRKAGVTRWCKVCSETRLSRYNEGDTCSACQPNRVGINNAMLMLNSIEWAV